MNIFVGNLSFDATQGDVQKLFEGFGNVASVVIVMRKEKKAPKSRGFGFVEMPDEQQALAAIAALNGKEFMGRVLNVNPTRPKTEAERKSEPKKKMPPKPKVAAEQYPQEEREQKKVWVSKHLALKDRRVRLSGQPGTYRGGRRTHSYIKRQELAGMPVEFKPRRRGQNNPMRWRKKKDQAKPWEKVEAGARPWKKTEGESKPWRKSESGIKSWRKTPGESKPWKKPAGDAKPWSKSSERPQKSKFSGRRKPAGYKK